MSDSQLPSQGCSIAYSDGASPEVYTAIGEIMGINGPSRQNPTLDSTDFSETVRSAVSSSVVDNGEVSVSVGYRPALASHQAIISKVNSGVSGNWKITYTDSPQSTDIFPAIVTGFSQGAPKDGLLTGEMTLKITGAIS